MLFFLVLPNDLPETFRGAQTGCAVVVSVGDAGMRMVQKRAGEIGVVAAARWRRWRRRVRNRCGLTSTPTVARVVLLITLSNPASLIGAPREESQRAEGGLSDRASTGLCWPR